VLLQDRDAIVKGLKDQIRKQLQFSQMAPGVKIMEPLTNQPVTAFEFGFKIRVRVKQRTLFLHIVIRNAPGCGTVQSCVTFFNTISDWGVRLGHFLSWRLCVCGGGGWFLVNCIAQVHGNGRHLLCFL